jgi:hypothetical protein
MAGERKALEQRLRLVADAQAGYFTATQASSAGYADSVHGYHVANGDWERPVRGVYRLSDVPLPAWPELPIWSLWTRGRDGEPQGVYSHETAMVIHGLRERRDGPLHMTVPRTFRKNCEIPALLTLHKADLAEDEIEQRAGFTVTTLRRTLADMGIESTRPIQDYDAVINAGED